MEGYIDYINSLFEKVIETEKLLVELEDTTHDLGVIKKFGIIRSIYVNDLHRKYLDYQTRIEEKFD